VGQPHVAVCVPFTSEILPLYPLLEIALLPSRIEGFSQALLEAMALGKPVVASAAGGNLDLVRHETDGLLVPPLDPGAWAAAIERLLGDAPLAARLGESARRTARVTFSLDRTVERTLQLYQSLRAGVPLAPAAPLR
jgi:glycosyltransferase involved in cell wall biosynthesis